MNFESTNSSEHELALTDLSCNSTCMCQKDASTYHITSDEDDSKWNLNRTNSSSFLDLALSSSDSDSDSTKNNSTKNNSTSGGEPTKRNNSTSALPSKPAKAPVKEISPQAKLCQHLRDINKYGGDLDVTMIPDSCAITYNPEAKYPINLDLGDNANESDTAENEDGPDEAAAPVAESSRPNIEKSTATTPEPMVQDGPDEAAAPPPPKIKKSAAAISPQEFYYKPTSKRE